MNFSYRRHAFVWLEQVGQDVRYALRQFGRTKAFSLVVVATLALGIGATTAIYSVVDTVLLHPIPGPAADRLVQVGEWIQFSNRQNPDLAGLSPKTGEALAVEAFETVPQLALAIERAGLKAPITSALARLIDGTLPLSDWVDLVRVSIPEPVSRDGRFRAWWRRVRRSNAQA